MSVHPLKARFLVAATVLFAAAPVFALYPSARTETRMVFDNATHKIVLFGGISSVDRGTKLPYEFGDTWERSGIRWVQKFPNHSPSKRSAHTMIYDSARERVVLFGGRTGTTNLNDTWVYRNDDWTQLNTPNSPSGRFLAGGAYDSVRDRFVIFGGNTISSDGKTTTAVYDTWEFDGTTWVQKGGTGPTVANPILVFDAARNQTIMLGLGENSVTLMYAYDPAAATWTQLKPANLPDCVNEGAAVYNSVWGNVFYTGGVCAGSGAIEVSMEWDGTNWVESPALTFSGRVFGAALTFDPDKDQMVYFGGTTIGGVTRSLTLVFQNQLWIDTNNNDVEPSPRSLYAFVTDPVNNAIWLYGGIDDLQVFNDFWKFQNGHWEIQAMTDQPAACAYPAATWDTDRNKMVLLCADSSMFEFTGTAWTQITTSKEAPGPRRQSMMVYDPTLKKTVLFGGWVDNYLDQTWTWDGTNWVRVKNKVPPPRALGMMWYDPTLKKTVLYGGIGRQTTDGRLVRFEDMWTFDGTNWTELKPTGGTPGMRYGAQVTVDPRTNKVVLFGGLRVDTSAAGIQTQVYADDTWEWDGAAWKKLAPAIVPAARENAGFTFDPIRNELVMFSGFAGSYHGDTWGYTNGAWKQRIEEVGKKRRSAR